MIKSVDKPISRILNSQFILKSTRYSRRSAFGSSLIDTLQYRYIKMKDLNEIRQQYKPQGTLKVISKACGFFMKQAWHDFKQDYQKFQQIKSIPSQYRTTEQKKSYRQIKIDLIKFGPAFLIFNVPFGFPLFYLYLKLFPQLIPSWMMVDSLYHEVAEKNQLRRKSAWLYYKQNLNEAVRMSYLKQAIFKQNQSLQDLRKISEICYGDYIDGTQFLSQKLNVEFKNGLIVPKISLFLLKRSLRTQLQHDYEIESELQQLQSFEEKLYYKLERQISKLSF